MKPFRKLGPIDEIQKYLDRQTKGWKLFFEEPLGVDYQFIKPQEGYSWDCTLNNLKIIMLNVTKIEGHYKHHMLIFKHDDKTRFIWCSWANLLYDASCREEYKLENRKLVTKIYNIITDRLSFEEKQCKQILTRFKYELAYQVYDSKGNYIAGFPTFIRACGYKYKFGKLDWCIKY